MATRKILQLGDETLRKKTKPVSEFNKNLHILLDDMNETLIKANGCGLSANQVGVLKSVCIVSLDKIFLEIINPIILKTSSKKIKSAEGCLSVLDDRGRSKYAEIERPANVLFKAQDRNGIEYTKKVSGFAARAVLHEIDHLNGVLYIDYIKDENGGKN